jgi:flagellar P-ring protein precursor FlgI
MTPLKGADGQVYAIAQGNMVVGGAARTGGRCLAGHQPPLGRPHPGRRHGRARGADCARPGRLGLFELNDSDFGTARRVVDAINLVYPGAASALDGRSIQVRAPIDPERACRLPRPHREPRGHAGAAGRQGHRQLAHRLGGHEPARDAAELRGRPWQPHGHGQPRPRSASRRRSRAGRRWSPSVARSTSPRRAAPLQRRGGANLADVVKALNTLGAKPMDLVSILQAMKAAGALRAELEVI